MRALLLAALLAPAAARAAVGGKEAGTSGAAFLLLGADARSAGMGNAVRASAEDAAAAYWNPAGLAQLHHRHAIVTHSAGFQGGFYDFLAYAQPLEGPRGRGRERELQPEQLGAVGLTLIYNNPGALREIDNTGAATGREFTPQDYAASVGWGVALLDNLDAGLSVKYVASRIHNSASTAAGDAGVRWRLFFPGLREDVPYVISASVHNAGGKLRFRRDADPLPMTVVLGQALRPHRSLLLSADLVGPRDRSPYVSFGGEWRAPMAGGVSGAVRGGYDGRLVGSEVGGAAGLSLGGGLGFRRLSVDLAWSPAGELGSTQKISLSYRF